jgi:hypothetical protein
MSADGAVATPNASKTGAFHRSCSTQAVCSLCEGFGEENHPRSKIVDGYSNPRYIYLHYPNPGLLRSSYKRYGCQTCRLILSCIQQGATGSLDPHGEQAQGDKDKLATFDIAQDTYEVARLVKSADFEINGEDLQIKGCGSGRVALHTRSWRKRGPRVFTGHWLKEKTLSVNIHVFNTAAVAPPLPECMKLYSSPG